MKKSLYTLIALSLCIISCTGWLKTPETVPADCIMLNIINSPMTKAIDPQGADYERLLNRLDCFFYPKGDTTSACIYYQKVAFETAQNKNATIPFYVDESVINTIFTGGNTECDVFVIANLPEGTFATGQTGTDVEKLSKILLDLEDSNYDYDAIDKPFIMAGLGIATKGDNNNASGTILLHRAATKITVTVNIPQEIVITTGNNSVIMKPVLTDNEQNVTLKTAFHYGVTKTYLRAKYDGENTFFNTAKKGYDFVTEIAATSETPKKYQYTCEVPFYSYGRAWEKGAEDAAYLTFEMPWTNVTDGNTQTYYYQILVNGAGRNLNPNNWYDLTVNVGVLGSTVESEPILLQDISYYILDWTTEPESETGDRYEDVSIQKYTYLQVPEKRIIINNTSTGVIKFEASHEIGIKLNTDNKTDEILGITTSSGAFYINCGVGKTERPKIESLPITTNNNFSIDNGKNIITYSYNIPNDVYSPIYVYATIWLELDGTQGMSVEEAEFSEDIIIVQYPPMYIVPDESTVYSIYVNEQQTNSSNDYKIGNHNLGRNPGHSNTNWDGNPSFMLTITVSAFNEGNTFKAHDGNYYPYIIGDPRSRISDIELDDDNSTNVSSNWVSADAVKYDVNGNIVRDVNGNIQYEQRSLQYYYPTETTGNSFQIVSPKFRMVSFFSSGWGNITSKGAEMRCATFQEDGYPAGRWRLPTEAEIMFVIDLQKAGVITDVFYGSSQYFAATEVNNTTRYKISFPTNGTPSWTSATTGSVRCVYDEWYWGSEREAAQNSNWGGSITTKGDNEYLFTWGDKQIW